MTSETPGMSRARGRASVAALLVILIAGACGATDSSSTGPSLLPSNNPPQAPAPEPPPDAGVVTFGPGRHRINSDLAPGRYYSDPVAGCYWERQRGDSGLAADTLAFGFVDFDAGQSVVDIVATDAAFEANSACGQWSNRPRQTSGTAIAPGVWLVGSQIAPGTYRTDAAAGCFWERLRDFSGATSAVIATELTPVAGAAFVTLLAGDTGFSSNGACGTWTPLAADEAPPPPPRLRTVPR